MKNWYVLLIELDKKEVYKVERKRNPDTSGLKVYKVVGMKRIVIIILISMSFFYSCMNKETRVKIEKIDSLLTQIDSLNYELEKVKIDSLKAVYSVTKSNTDFFRTTKFDMPEDKSFMKDFGAYGLVDKNLKRLLKNYKKMNTDIEYSNNQLINLRHDIKKELLTNNDTINNYILDEETALNSIKTKLLPKIKLLNRQLPLYNKVRKSVENFKKSLEEN